MNKQTIGTLIITTAALMTGLTPAAQQRPAPGSQPDSGPGAAAPPITLRAASFTPTRGELPALAPGLTIAGYAADQRGYYLVQFQGPILESWKAEVTDAGAELLDYVPDFAFKVRMNPAEAARVERLAPVAWVGLYHPGYKLSPDLARTATGAYLVRIERGANAAVASANIAATGAQIVQREGLLLMVAADSGQLDAIARVLDVAEIENFLPYVKHNEFGAGVIMGAGAANTRGFDGSTQTIAIGDTGLGNGTAATAFVDLPASRITAIFNWPGVTSTCFSSITNDGAVDVDSGHGTHTTTSALGSGGPGGEGRGTAPGAHLVFQALENWVVTSSLCKLFYGLQNGYYLVGIPSDLRQLFQQAYDNGARVHSDSWGSDAAGAYTTDSVNTDQFVWSHRDMTVTFSAGNAGTDANADGAIDLGSIGSPATAKNVISVGASENDRQGHWECDSALSYTSCAAQAGQNAIFTYGSAWANYPTNPIKDDPTAGNAQQMAAFSSRGPTDDGRIKPDVVAPGTWVLSAYSDKFQQQYDSSPNPQNGVYQYDGWGHPLNQNYKYMGGTSMSNPLVAGAAAVVRDFYQKTGALSASAALVKATLVNSAVDLLDENNDGINDNAFPIPNTAEGWGRVDLAAATDGSRQFVDQAVGLATNGVATYTYSIGTAGLPFRVTLAWSDYPSTTSAAKNLVNDLDLKVTAPDGSTTYFGNVFAGGWSRSGGAADRTNNLENVYVASASAGTWTVEVRGFNVPNGPQPFAIVVDGEFGTPPPPPVPPADPTGLVATTVSSSQIDLTWSDNSANEDAFDIERCESSGCSNFVQAAQVGANTLTYRDSALSASTTYVYRVRARNGGGVSNYSNSAEATTLSLIPSPPTGLVATAGNAQVTLTWNSVANATSYNVKRGLTSGGPYGDVLNLTATTYTDTNLPNGTPYFYVVTARNTFGESAPSNEATATPGGPVPAAPTNLRATAGNAEVALTWDAVANATNYTVKRSLTPGGNYGVVTTIAATSYTDTNLVNGTTYYYVVTASNASGESGASNEASATPGGAVPTAPTNLTALSEDARITLSWNAVPAASSYSVKRSLTSGSGYGVVSSVATTTYTDLNLVNGTAYYYIVTAVNASGESAPSNQATATPQPSVPVPSPPTGLVATPGNGQVVLAWNAAANATSYTINRSLSSGTGYGVVTSVTATSYTDINLVNGTQYYYLVTASNAAGTSAPSNEASATPFIPLPAAPTGLTGVAGNAQVALSWTGVSDATGYRVKRSTTAGGPYVIAATGLTTTSYTDTNLVNGTTYFYVVTGLNGSAEGPPSNEISATPQQPPPPAPTGLAVTVGPGARKLSLSWNLTSGATSYSLKRSIVSGGPYTLIANGITTTTYTDNGLQSGRTYYYVVSATGPGGDGPNSAQASGTTR